MASRGVSISRKARLTRESPKVPVPEQVNLSVLTDFPLEPVTAEGIFMDLYTDEELRRIAIPVTSSDLELDSSGLRSLQMGPDNGDLPCATCNRKIGSPGASCPGHMGRIVLNVPIIKPLFYQIVFNVLQSICSDCGHTVLSKAQLQRLGEQYSGQTLLAQIAKESKGQVCSTRSDQIPEGAVPCRVATRDYKKRIYPDQFKIGYTSGKGKNQKLSYMDVQEAYRILSRISPEEARLLGFPENIHPKDLITWVLPVLPPCTRPPKMRKGQLEQDPLTGMYRSVMDLNDDLRNLIPGTVDYEKKVRELNFRIYQLMMQKDSTSGQAQSSSITRILAGNTGKESLLRSYTMGKRVDFNARAVIVPDPNLGFDEIRVPRSVAEKLSMPEMVTPSNIHKLQRLWNQGKINSLEYGETRTLVQNGVPITEVILSPGIIIVDQKLRDSYTLKVGDKVHRQLQDGDQVMFGRYPSLHTGSMMSHRISIWDHSTFALPLSVTTPYNADFDGDEMNLHVPQDESARAEMTQILNVKSCQLDDQISGPRFGLTFDELALAPILSWTETRVPAPLFFELLQRITNPDKDTVLERLEEISSKTGSSYRFQYWNITEPSQKIVREILNSGVYAEFINPEIEVPESQLRLGTGKPRAVVEFSYPLSESESRLMDLLKKAQLQVKILDEFTGKATFSMALPANFNYSRGKWSSRLIKLIGEADPEMLEVLDQIGYPYDKLVVFDSDSMDLEDQLLGAGLAVTQLKQGLEVNLSKTPGLQIPPELLQTPHQNQLLFKDLDDNPEYMNVLMDTRGDLTWVVEEVGKPPIRIDNGILWLGEVSKADVGVKPGSIFHRLTNYYDVHGTQRSAQVLNDLPWILNRWGVNYGLSMGYTDCLTPAEYQHKLDAELAQIRVNATAMGAEPTNPIERQKWNERLVQELYRTTVIGEKIQKELLKDKSFMKAVGNDPMRAAQVFAFLAQLYYDGERLGMDGRASALFDFDDSDIAAHGFIESNFTRGLNLSQSIMAMYSGIQGLIAKAILTALTGYANRKANKALQSIVILADGSARDFNGNLFQIYGTELFSPARVEPTQASFTGARYQPGDISYLADLVNASE